MLLKLILNLFSRRKQFKCAKNTFKLFIRFDLVFYQTPYNTTWLIR